MVALVVTGCDTTQQKSARAKLQAQRILATRVRVLVTQANPSVTVPRVTLVRGRGRGAIVVALHNAGALPAIDLPISVGVRRAGHAAQYLNHRKGLAYFQTHAPAIAPGGTATWVFTLPRGRAPSGRAFALVGSGSSPAAPLGSRLPSLELSALGAPSRAVSARVRNSSSVPQYGLDVYAYAERDGRFVAAGRASIAALGGGHATTVEVPLTGDARGAQIHLETSPTIFK